MPTTEKFNIFLILKLNFKWGRWFGKKLILLTSYLAKFDNNLHFSMLFVWTLAVVLGCQRKGQRLKRSSETLMEISSKTSPLYSTQNSITVELKIFVHLKILTKLFSNELSSLCVSQTFAGFQFFRSRNCVVGNGKFFQNQHNKLERAGKLAKTTDEMRAEILKRH